jgi:hypothetical protein
MKESTIIFVLIADLFLLVIGGRRKSLMSDQMELRSLDQMNYPVPTALRSLKKPSSRNLHRRSFFNT